MYIKYIPALLVVFISSIKTACTQEPAKSEFDVTLSIKNQHYWRGGPIGFSPLVTSQASFKVGGFEAGTWNGFGFDGVFKDVDTYISYTKSGFTIALWDVYNFTDPSSGKADPATFPADYFDYNAKTTRHFIDLSVTYQLEKIPLKFFLATIIHGRDRALTPDDYTINSGNTMFSGTRSGKNRYSTYFNTSYTFKTKKADFNIYSSTGFALNNADGTTFYGPKQFGITEIGATVDKNIKITDTYAVAISAGVVASPVNKSINGLLAVKLF